MVKPYDLPPTDLKYYRGLLELSPDAVRAALNEGANVNRTDMDGYGHPFESLMTGYTHLFSGRTAPWDEREYERKRRDLFVVAGVILSFHPDLSEKNDLGASRLDHIISFHYMPPHPAWEDVAARAVIQSLRKDTEGGGVPYMPNYDAIFMDIHEPSKRQGAMDTIERVHVRVRQRLAAPSTEDEAMLVAHKDRIDFWMTAFQRPDIDFLPCPTPACLRAGEAFSRSAGALMNVLSTGNHLRVGGDTSDVKAGHMTFRDAGKAMDRARAEMKALCDARAAALKKGPGNSGLS